MKKILFLILLCLGGAGSARAQYVSVTWEHDGANTTGYHLYCDALPYPVKLAATTQPTIKTAHLYGQTVGSTLYCRVRAFNAVGESGDSPIAFTVVANNKINVVPVLRIAPTIP